MNSKLNVIFVCFIINLITICDVCTVNASLSDSLVIYNDSKIREFDSKDIYNLHHSFVFEELKWKDGRINFKIDKKFNDDEIDEILAAMYEIERSSCIRFAAHHPSNGPNYVMIMKDYARPFSSDLGCHHKGEQLLTFADDVSVNEHQTILHGMLTTIGFSHQHQRSDRDQYIEIHLENTNLSESDILENFAPKVNFDPRVKYLTPFDFNSVMLYHEFDFSDNGKSVITSKIEGVNLPTSVDRGLSKYDKILLNRFYDCEAVDKTKSKLFYENEVEILYPMVVDMNEIRRARSSRRQSNRKSNRRQ